VAAVAVGGLDESLWYTADWDFWLKLAATVQTAYIPRPLSGFRVHAASQTISRGTGQTGFGEQLETVLDRHLTRFAKDNRRAAELHKVSRFSIELNNALASATNGRRLDHLGLTRRFLALGPHGWHRFLRDSRIAERVSARWRARLLNGS
jgi:hypothetical protein